MVTQESWLFAIFCESSSMPGSWGLSGLTCCVPVSLASSVLGPLLIAVTEYPIKTTRGKKERKAYYGL